MILWREIPEMFFHATYHTLSANRMFRLLPQISTVGFLPEKKVLVNHMFQSCNFSFILRGCGEYFLKGKHYEVKAPCMLIQMPGEPMFYQPAESWSEMFFIYPAETYPIWNKAGLLDPENPVREMKNANLVMAQAESLQKMLTQPNWNGDRLDLLCYSLILETWEEDRSKSLEHTMIPAIRKRIEATIGQDIDCNELAREFHMSLSSLRRYWTKYHGNESFMEYRNSCFLRQACRYLTETAFSIKEIAEKLNFSDQFYFSRKFHQLSGIPPVEYRKKYRNPYSFSSLPENEQF